MCCERTECDMDSGGERGRTIGDDTTTTAWGRSRDDTSPHGDETSLIRFRNINRRLKNVDLAEISVSWWRLRFQPSLHVLAMCYRHLLQFLYLKLNSFFGRTARRRRCRSVATLTSGECWMPSHLITFLVFSALVAFTDACSSRNTPKPRPPPPSARPNVTFPTYTCPPAYAAWYCLNGATCFTIKIEDSLLYNCECASGFMGQRCEYKDLDGSYFPSRQRVLLETASIAGGATIAVFLVVIICATLYVHYQRRAKQRRIQDMDHTDSIYMTRAPRPFSRSLSLSIPMERLDERHKELTVKAKSQLAVLKTDSTAYRVPP